MDIIKNNKNFCIFKVHDSTINISEIKKKGIFEPHPIEKKGTDGYNNKKSG
jgi:hypothetical protein